MLKGQILSVLEFFVRILPCSLMLLVQQVRTFLFQFTRLYESLAQCLLLKEFVMYTGGHVYSYSKFPVKCFC